MAVGRVVVIKALIVIVAALGTAAIAFAVSYLVFGFDWVSRGRALSVPITWPVVAGMVLPNLAIAFFVKRWWSRQTDDPNTGAGHSSSLPWLVVISSRPHSLSSIIF